MISYTLPFTSVIKIRQVNRSWLFYRMLISCGDTSLLHAWYAIGRTGGPAGQFRSRNPRQSSIVKRCIRSSSYEFRFFSAASFCALPSPIMTATPCLSPSISLFLSPSFLYFHQAFLFYVRSFSPRLSTSHFEAIVTLRYDCSMFDRSQVADDYKTIRVYAITSAERKRHRNGESFHSCSFCAPSVLHENLFPAANGTRLPRKWWMVEHFKVRNIFFEETNLLGPWISWTLAFFFCFLLFDFMAFWLLDYLVFLIPWYLGILIPWFLGYLVS